MATNTGSEKTSSSPKAKSSPPIARQVRERVRKNLAPAARRTGKQLGKAFQATARAAGKTAKVLAIRAKVSARQLRMRGLFQKIGESFYRAGKSGTEPQENAAALQPLLDQVDKLNGEIGSLKLQEKKIRSGK
jgi:protein-disulfide isomerase-like protein with CxxC motif